MHSNSIVLKATGMQGVEEKWRKCMGIEPTSPTVHARLAGFEDRGHHQVCFHFRFFHYCLVRMD